MKVGIFKMFNSEGILDQITLFWDFDLRYIIGDILAKIQRRRGWVARGARAPLAPEIQKIFGNFKTLYQLRMCMMTSCDSSEKY